MTEQPIWYAKYPVTMENGPTEWVAGVRVNYDDKSCAIRDDAQHGYLGVHGDGAYGFAADTTDPQTKPKDIGWNLLEYPAESDRQDGLKHPTYIVAWRQRV